MPILRIDNRPLLEGKEHTFLSVAAAAADATLTVSDIEGIAVGQYLLIGDFGVEKSEITRVHTSTAPSGSTVTLATAISFAHAVGTKVTQIDYNQVEFSRATTVAGSKSVLSTEAVEADDTHTTYNDTTNSTGYGFGRYKNSASTTYSSYSGAIPYAGLSTNSVRKMKDAALGITSEKISSLITDDFLLTELNNWQQDITRQKNWSFEQTSATDTVVSGQNAYPISTVISDLKHVHEGQAIIQMRIKNYERLEYIDKREFDNAMTNTIYTTLNGAVLDAASTITLTDSSDFGETGTIVIGSDEITFTANDTDTNILTVTASTVDAHDDGSTVWLKQSLGLPGYWTLYEDNFYLEPVSATDYDGLSIHIDYYKALPALTGDTDTTEIPFYELSQYYLAWKIEAKKKNTQQADYWRQIYENRLAGEMRRNRSGQYFRFTLKRP